MPYPRPVVVCFLLMLLSLAGCGSTRHVAVEVEVRNYGTREPIHNALVSLYWMENLRGKRPTTFVTHSGETDAGGCVSFEKLPEGIWEVHVRVPGYAHQSAWVVLQQPEDDGVWGSYGWVPCRPDRGSPTRGSEVIEILAAAQAVEGPSRGEEQTR